MFRFASVALLAALALVACNRQEQAQPEQPAKKPGASAKTAKSKAKSKTPAHATPSAEDGPKRYIVPFAWEASNDEPLSHARSYLKEILTDNRVYMEHGPRFFEAFADGQKPRATVVTCSDSRVHTPAFDTTPENDDFMIRNIGNQVANAEGSVEYGVEHLETPVLMILGHTGCGAVKAAMGDISGQSEPVRRELEKLQLPKPKANSSPESAWAEMVVANVHNQVAFALQHFGSRVREGKLTVVGAVYDFRDDLGNGRGKVTIVDVNGNGEPQRMKAFVDAVEGDGDTKRKVKDSPTGKAHGGKAVARAEEARKKPLSQSDEKLVEALGQIPGLLVQRPIEPKSEKTAAAQPGHANAKHGH